MNGSVDVKPERKFFLRNITFWIVFLYVLFLIILLRISSAIGLTQAADLMTDDAFASLLLSIFYSMRWFFITLVIISVIFAGIYILIKKRGGSAITRALKIICNLNIILVLAGLIYMMLV